MEKEELYNTLSALLNSEVLNPNVIIKRAKLI